MDAIIFTTVVSAPTRRMKPSLEYIEIRALPWQILTMLPPHCERKRRLLLYSVLLHLFYEDFVYKAFYRQ